MHKNSIGLRLVISFAIIIALQIPIFMIQSLIADRNEYREEAIRDITSSWSGKQQIGGPVLSFTAEEKLMNIDKKEYIDTKNFRLLPDSLLITVRLYPEKRYRGIFEVAVYQSSVKIIADIDARRLKNLLGTNRNYSIQRSTLDFGVQDLRGITGDINLTVDGKRLEVNPGMQYAAVYDRGFHTNFLADSAHGNYHIELEYKLKGSESLSFIPFGKNTKVIVSSTWKDPSFTGAFLPENRKVTENGFEATWLVSHFNRSFPQEWIDDRPEFASSIFGVNLLFPVDEYQKTNRTSKYGILILLLTFVAFFLIELFNKKLLHPIQYLLVGLALVIFYSLLLSLSEYMMFQYAYIIASVLVIGIIGIYTSSVYNSRKIGGIISGLLFFFYAFLYVLMQLEDLSLLVGTLTLFIILTLVMWVTRGINWFAIMDNKQKQNESDEFLKKQSD